MLNPMSKPIKVLGGLCLLVLVTTILMISISGNRVSKPVIPHYIQDNAAADNKVEALKTVTANLLAVQRKNAQLSDTINALKNQQEKTFEKLQEKITQQVHVKLMQLKQAVPILPDKPAQLPFMPPSSQSIQRISPSHFIWLSDLSTFSNQKQTVRDANQQESILFSSSNKKTSHFLLSDTGHQLSGRQKQAAIRPMYTIPENATLTNATLVTPLIGRVPIDGKLTSPYWFKLVLSAENLTANGYPLPGVHGAVMSGVASGDLLGSCVRGTIRSMTFIFNDGRISTIDAKEDDHPLGYLSSETGNPCLHGSFHSNATVFLGAQMGLAGLQGYADALASAQTMTTMSPQGGKFSALIGSASRMGFGKGLSATAQAAQTWWNQRVHNAFDYVFVSNRDPKTHRAMKVVVNTMREIPIDDDPQQRRVSYEISTQNHTNQLD